MRTASFKESTPPKTNMTMEKLPFQAVLTRKLTHVKMHLRLEMVIFHCHVRTPRSNLAIFQRQRRWWGWRHRRQGWQGFPAFLGGAPRTAGGNMARGIPPRLPPWCGNDDCYISISNTKEKKPQIIDREKMFF